MVLMEGARPQQGVTRRKMGQLGHVGIGAWQGMPSVTPLRMAPARAHALYPSRSLRLRLEYRYELLLK